MIKTTNMNLAIILEHPNLIIKCLIVDLVHGKYAFEHKILGAP